MNIVFVFCFWLILFVLTLIALIFNVEAQESLDKASVTFQGQGASNIRQTDLLSSRDILTAGYILSAIALILELFIFIVGGMYGFCSFYGNPIIVWIVYLFLVVWFVITYSIIAYASHEIGTSPTTLDDLNIGIAERDLALVQICLLALVIILLVGFFAYSYIIEDCETISSCK